MSPSKWRPFFPSLNVLNTMCMDQTRVLSQELLFAVDIIFFELI